MKLIVKNQEIYPYYKYKTASDSVDFVNIEIELSKEWDGMTCAALFTQNDLTYQVWLKNEQPFAYGTDGLLNIKMPHEIADGQVSISVIGVLAGGTVLGTSVPYIHNILKSGYTSDVEESLQPTPTALAQLVKVVQDESTLAQEAKSTAVTKADEATASALTAVDAKNSASASALSATNAANTAQQAAEQAAEAAGTLDIHSTDDLEEGSTNLYYPSTDKAKLAGIEEGANALPSKTDLTNKILSINSLGVLEWVANVIGLPSVSGNNGKILTTDGNTANWSNAINGYLQAIGFIGSSLQNAGGTNYGYISLGSGGVTISRNLADANSAFTVNQVNAGSTGKIADFQFGGNSKAYVNTAGTVAGQYLMAFGATLTISTPNTVATADATGSKGQIRWDTDNIYVCTDTNSWKQTALKPVGKTDTLELIEKIIVGYTIMAEQPADWATNWTNYYTNTGTAIEPIYTAVSGTSAPIWQANTYYSFDPNGVISVIRYKDTLGNDYNFTAFADKIKVPSVTSGAGQFSRRVYNMGTIYNPAVIIGGGSRNGSSITAVSYMNFHVFNLLGYWKSILNSTTVGDDMPYYNGAEYSNPSFPKFSVVDYPTIKGYQLALNGANIIPSLTEIEIRGIRA